MAMNDNIAAALSKINNAEKVGKKLCIVRPASIMIKKVLTLFNDNNLIGDTKEINDGRGNSLEVNLIGKINKCSVIKPRFVVNSKNFEKFEKRFLPAKGFGIIIVTTNKGIITLDKAKSLGIGGKLIAYCY